MADAIGVILDPTVKVRLVEMMKATEAFDYSSIVDVNLDTHAF